MTIREFQKKYGLVVDGIAGPITIAKMLEVISEYEQSDSLDVKMNGNIKWIEIDPLQLSTEVVNDKVTELAKKYHNFCTGMFNDGTANARLYCLLVKNGVKLYSPKWYDPYRKGTFVVYNDGRVEVETLRDIKDVSNIHLVFQGFNLDYEANGSTNLDASIKKEGWLADVKRWTDRNAVGYNYRKNKIIIVHQYADAHTIRRTIRGLGCTDKYNNTVAVCVDAGSMDCFVANGYVYHDGGGVMRNILTFIK